MKPHYARARRVTWSVHGVATAVVATILTFAAAPASAGICTTPGSHAGIQAAIDDPSCSEVQLSAQTYLESIVIGRSLALTGPTGGGAVIRGLVQVQGAGTAVVASDLRVESGCPGEAMDVSSGARLDGLNVEVVRANTLPCPPAALLSDSFETGDTTAWSSAIE